MGVMYMATCPKCNYNEQFFLGSGFNSINLFLSIQSLNQEEQEKIKNMEEKGEISCFSVENKLTKCCNCSTFGQLKQKVIVTITDQLHNNYKFGHKCDTCGNELEIYDENITKKNNAIMCPKCGEGFLTFNIVGMWD